MSCSDKSTAMGSVEEIVAKKLILRPMGVGAERPRNWGGTTAFGADVGRIDPGRIDRYPNSLPDSI